MPDSVAALVLAAGGGTRLRPLTLLRPKALCPVGGAPLLDHALRAIAVLGLDTAVNARYFVDQLAAAVDGRAHLSDESSHPEELGTGGAVGALRGWLDGRAVLVVNGDTWSDVDLAPLLGGWDGERVRVLVHGPAGTPLMSDAAWAELAGRNHGRTGPWRAQPVPGAAAVVASLVPAGDVSTLPAAPLGLSNGLWWPARAAGRLDVVTGEGRLVPCDTPRAYLRANLAVSAGETVVGEGAVVDGVAERCVLWPGVRVRPGEVLVDAIRAAAEMTVLIR